MIASGRADLRVMVRFDLDGGPVGIWSDTYPLTMETVVYNPAAISLGSVGSRKGLSSEQLDVTVSLLSPSVATIMSGIAWHQRPVVVFHAFVDGAGDVLGVVPVFSGFLDAAPVEDEDGGTLKMTLVVESNNRELSRSSGRMRSDADQRLVSASDGFFKHTTASTVDSKIFWGRKGPQRPV